MQQKRTIFYVLGGNKHKAVYWYEYDNRADYLWDVELEPYDIVDQDDHNTWFDYGDE